MFSFLKLCINNFGFGSGLIIYLRLKVFKNNRVNIPGLPEPVYLRTGTSDLHTFREIFLREEYSIKLPFTPKTIIDAGANVGFTTLFFHRAYPTAKIVSLEPDADNFRLLEQNTTGYQNIHPHQHALFNRIGEIKIVDEGHGIRGFMAREISDGQKGQTMPCTTLVELMTHHNLTKIDILKMDIEGSELEVFQHEPEKWLPKVKCLIIELHDRMKPGCSKTVFQAVSKYNFELSIKGENLVFLNRDYLTDRKITSV
jgi:FkbM family methyltransferase